MPLNISHAEDAFLLANTEFQDWMQIFEAQWYEPVGEMLVSVMMAQLPPEVKEQLRKLNPQAFDQVEKHYGGK